MELKKRFDFRYVFIGLFCFCLLVYIVVGLQPAGAAGYQISGEFFVPKIGLKSDVTTLDMHDRKLDTPDDIVGSFSQHPNKTLLIGHSTTVFRDLGMIRLGDSLVYNGESYSVEKIEVATKDRIKMGELLKDTDDKTIVVMTCAGRLLGDGEATHRLIITASIR